MEQYSQLFHSKNIKLINPIWGSFKKENVVGWHLSAPSVVRKNKSLEFIQNIIDSETLPYYIDNYDEYSKEFFVMKNPA
jgi:hypothetical protein